MTCWCWCWSATIFCWSSNWINTRTSCRLRTGSIMMSGTMVFYTLFTVTCSINFIFFQHKNKKYVSIFAEVLSLCSCNVIVICCPVVSNPHHFAITVFMCPASLRRELRHRWGTVVMLRHTAVIYFCILVMRLHHVCISTVSQLFSTTGWPFIWWRKSKTIFSFPWRLENVRRTLATKRVMLQLPAISGDWRCRGLLSGSRNPVWKGH